MESHIATSVRWLTLVGLHRASSLKGIWFELVSVDYFLYRRMVCGGRYCDFMMLLKVFVVVFFFSAQHWTHPRQCLVKCYSGFDITLSFLTASQLTDCGGFLSSGIWLGNSLPNLAGWLRQTDWLAGWLWNGRKHLPSLHCAEQERMDCSQLTAVSWWMKEEWVRGWVAGLLCW